MRPEACRSCAHHRCPQGLLLESGKTDVILVSRAAIAKYHRQHYFHNRTLCSYTSGGWKSKTGVPVGLVSSEATLAVFFHSLSSVSVVERASSAVCVASYEDASSLDQGPLSWPRLTLPSKGPISKYSYFGVRPPTYELGRNGTIHSLPDVKYGGSVDILMSSVT